MGQTKSKNYFEFGSKKIQQVKWIVISSIAF